MRLSNCRSLLRLITVLVVGCGVYFILGTGSVTGQAICKNCGSSFQSPTARPGGPYVGMTGQNISLDGGGSWSGDDGWITGYYWDFGDGTWGSGSSPNHQYNADGVYTVTLSVSESNEYRFELGQPWIESSSITFEVIRKSERNHLLLKVGNND